MPKGFGGKGFGGKGGKGRGGKGWGLGAAIIASATVGVAVACTRRRGCHCCSCQAPRRNNNVVVIRETREPKPAVVVVREPPRAAPAAAKTLSPPAYAELVAVVQTREPPAWKKANTCHCCQTKFSLFGASRHHCRKCGQSCCASCSPSTARLPELGLDSPVRVCNSCVTVAVPAQRPKVAVATVYKDHTSGKLYTHDSATGQSMWVEPILNIAHQA